jgi:hypothetical protein
MTRGQKLTRRQKLILAILGIYWATLAALLLGIAVMTAKRLLDRLARWGLVHRQRGALQHSAV